MKRNTQEYDNTLNALFGDEAAEIIPNLVAGTRLLGEENTEIDRSKLKADLVYRVLYDQTPVILNLELQTSLDKDIGIRLLQYSAGLYAKHGLPVISIVIYPFKIAIPCSPFRMGSPTSFFWPFTTKRSAFGNWTLHHSSKTGYNALYTLLPAMKGAKTDLLKQALQEMAQIYTRQQLGHHLLRFHRIMQRAKTMTDQDKQEVEEALFMQYGYDEFIDDNPLVIERVERGKAEGKIEGKVLGLQQSVLNIQSLRFPQLLPHAQPVVASIQDPDQLDQLVKHLIVAPDPQTVQQLLHLAISDH